MILLRCRVPSHGWNICISNRLQTLPGLVIMVNIEKISNEESYQYHMLTSRLGTPFSLPRQPDTTTPFYSGHPHG